MTRPLVLELLSVWEGALKPFPNNLEFYSENDNSRAQIFKSVVKLPGRFKSDISDSSNLSWHIIYFEAPFSVAEHPCCNMVRATQFHKADRVMVTQLLLTV